MRQLAEAHCEGRLVLVLEGGYDRAALAGSARACLEVLTGRDETFPAGVQRAGDRRWPSSREALAGFWPLR